MIGQIFIHDVKEFKMSAVTVQDNREYGISFSRRIELIDSNGQSLNFTMFADKREYLEIDDSILP